MTTQALWNLLEELGDATAERFDPATISDLPEPARRFLSAAIAEGTPLATGVELEMTGRIKLGIWLPFTARQILRAGIGLVWAPVVGGRIIRFVGADTLGPDGASMQFRFHDRFTIVNARGPDTDRSAAGRLAAETAAWLPQALTPQAGATWKHVDADRAIVVLGGPSGAVDVELTIDADGRLTEIDLQRWNDSIKPAGYRSFGGTVHSGLRIDGVTIAKSGTVAWDRDTPTRHDAEFFRYRVNSARFLVGSTGASH